MPRLLPLALAAAIPATFSTAKANEALDAQLDAIGPGIKKWATICIVTTAADGRPEFTWHDYRDSGASVDFWPASCIKLYTAIAALEFLNERGFPLDSTVTFEHAEPDGTWVLDCARSLREMLSEIFRVSSNVDYTLLLRLVGIDRINSQFLVPEKGFPHSALMRGYVLGRPYGYVREETQRITLTSIDGRRETLEHRWTGRSYSEERGASIFDAKTGNVTSPHELAECLRRVLFHESLPDADRYRLTPDQLEFLRHGAGGLCGLENKRAESDPVAWKSGLDAVFPNAHFYHKCGAISSYTLETAYLDDSKTSGRRFILVPVIAAGTDNTPVSGMSLISAMSRAIGEWVRDQPTQQGH